MDPFFYYTKRVCAEIKLAALYNVDNDMYIKCTVCFKVYISVILSYKYSK